VTGVRAALVVPLLWPLLWTFLWLCTVAACGGPASRPVVALAPVPASPEEAFATPPPRPPAREAGVSRAALDATLNAGPGAFLGTVKLRAVTSGGRFVGWKILAMDARYASSGVKVGDVVRSVNGQRIERPDDMVGLWQVLRTANVVELDIIRDGSTQMGLGDEVVRVPVHE
jgi:S1-C subfamily serine protease